MNQIERIEELQDMFNKARDSYDEVEIGCGSRLRQREFAPQAVHDSHKERGEHAPMGYCISCCFNVAIYELKKLKEEIAAGSPLLFEDEGLPKKKPKVQR